MNISKTKNKLSKLSDSKLEVLDRLVKQEFIKRGKVNSLKERVSNFTSNTVNTGSEQSAALSRMFEQAWIHG